MGSQNDVESVIWGDSNCLYIQRAHKNICMGLHIHILGVTLSRKSLFIHSNSHSTEFMPSSDPPIKCIISMKSAMLFNNDNYQQYEHVYGTPDKKVVNSASPWCKGST